MRQSRERLSERGSSEEMTGVSGQAMPQRGGVSSPAQVSRQEAVHWIQGWQAETLAHTPGWLGSAQTPLKLTTAACTQCWS